MQLDRTRIPIEERSFLHLLDLSLRVVREHALPLLLTSALGVVPFFFLNDYLTGSVFAEDSFEPGSSYFWHVAWMLVLIGLEVPFASIFTTLYLGQALFLEKMSFGRLVRDALGSLPQLILFQGLLRAVISVWPCFVNIPLPFILWPYLTEVIVLERNPIRARTPGGISTFSRTLSLHRHYRADLFGRWFASMWIGGVWILALWQAMIWARFTFTGDGWDMAIWRYLLPVAVWIVVSYFNVVRFLAYLDLRIRNEGWEIDLRMRAEGDRLMKQLA